MLYEMRTYTLKPGQTARWLELYEAHALPVLLATEGMTLIGYFRTEVGPLNRVIHIWSYPDFEARARALALVTAHPAWARDFLPQAQSCLEAQETALLSGARFSPLQ